MRGSRLGRTVFVGALVLGLMACTALTGVGDLVVDDALDGSSTPTEASVPAKPDTGTVTPGPDATPNPDPDDAATDGGILPTVDATVIDACSPTGCEVLPANFSLVALGASNAACPAGFAAPVNGVENPTFDPGACSCGACSVTQQPSCNAAAGPITLTYGPAGGNACPSTGQSVSPGCATDGFNGPFLAFDRSYVAPRANLAGGTCAPNVVKNAAKLKTTAVRVCSATQLPQCDGKTCIPAVAPFSACIAASGTQTCPSGWPERHIVGSSASFSCSNGCTCNVAGTCSATGHISYFSSANCTGTAGMVYDVDGTCRQTPGSIVVFTSHRYDPDPPTGVSCQGGGSSTPSTPTLAEPLTVCCK